MKKDPLLPQVKKNLKTLNKIHDSLELLRHETISILNSMALAKPLEKRLVSIKKQTESTLNKVKKKIEATERHKTLASSKKPIKEAQEFINKKIKQQDLKIKEFNVNIKVIKAKIEKAKRDIEKQYMY